ncbi:hypothetical protein POTOM_011744 [Populus tomentosa]|uniref:Uncharacterized protein n=1 Tax=Populus tomentosa TaxID=118781 RepID=A0A8X8D8W8_POPTO|nr:hypothetical protein POTOM_011744 [Populus tomentosa]
MNCTVSQLKPRKVVPAARWNCKNTYGNLNVVDIDSLDGQRQNTPPDIKKKSNLVIIVLCHYCLLYIVLQASESSCRKSVQLQVLHTYKVEVTFMISFSATNVQSIFEIAFSLRFKSFKFDTLGQ